MTSATRATQNVHLTTFARTMAAPASEVTVLVVETQQMVGCGLTSLLATFDRLRVVGCAHTSNDAVNLVGEAQPQVVILDARIEGGAEAAVRRFTEVSSGSAVLVLGLDEPVLEIARALTAGASGYVTKHQPIEELVAAVFDVRAGRRVIAPEALDPLLDHVAHGSPMELSERQRHILQLLADGSRATDIAVNLGINVGTLRNQVRGLLIRLGAHSQLEAVAIARRCGLLTDAPPVERAGR